MKKYISHDNYITIPVLILGFMDGWSEGIADTDGDSEGWMEGSRDTDGEREGE